MHILQLSHKPPFPAVDGGALAMAQVTEGLLEAGQEVRLLTLHTDKHPFQADKVSQEILHQTKFEGIFADTTPKPSAAFLNLFSANSYQLQRFDVPEMHQRLSKVLTENSYDIVHLESLFMVPYLDTIRKHSRAKVVLRSHNVEYQLGEAKVQSLPPGIKKHYWNLLTKRLKRFELAHQNAYDGLACISEQDRQHFLQSGTTIPSLTLPLGLKLPESGDTRSGTGLVFLGALDWAPNIEGLEWFVKHCWPEIKQNLPELQFRIAGRNPGSELENLSGNGVSIIGEVPDAASFLQSGALVVAPVLSGSGVRVKVLEALALGLPLATTTKGIEGTELIAGTHLLVADDPRELGRQIVELAKNPEIGQQMGLTAARFMALHHLRHKVTERLIQFYQSLLSA